MTDDELEHAAWAAFSAAIDDWKQRGAPSLGARAKSILRTHLDRPSHYDRAEEFLGLYLSQEQMIERGEAPRRVPMSEVRAGL